MTTTSLPDPDPTGGVETAIDERASRRSFASEPVSIDDVGRLLWSVQGITHTQDGVPLRAPPSAGATYPLVAYLSVAPTGCEVLDAGLYRYEHEAHQLETVIAGSIHDDLTRAALHQDVIGGAPVVIAIAADYERTRRQYPDHGTRYVHMEAGHAAQNALLLCEARGLNACPVGAFDDSELAAVLELPDELDPLYLVPFGKPLSR